MWVNHDGLPKIHPDDIVVGRSIKNIRKTYSELEITELAQSIQDHGLLSPLLLQQTEDTDGSPIWELVAGSRRLRAIQLVRSTSEPTFYDEIPYVPYEGQLEDAVFANAAENIDRADLNVIDVCEWLVERVDEGWSKADLAKRFSKQQGWVDQRIFFIKHAVEMLVAAVKAGKISFAAGVEIAKKTKADQEKLLKANEKWLDKLTAEDVQRDGDPERVKRPTKKMIEKTLDRIKAAATDQPDNEELRGMELSLRWVVGLLDTSEFNEAIDNATGEAPVDDDEGAKEE